MLPTYNMMAPSDSTSAPLMQNQESMSFQGYAAQPVPVAQPVQSVPIQPVNPVQSAPIPAQPVGMAPPVNPNPLEYLMQFNGVRIVENVNLWEVLTEYNATKRYGIFLTNENGEIQENQLPFYNAYEESECCQRQMCGTNREFNMNICGPDGQVLVKMHRPFTCQFFCLNTPEMHILDANEQTCGLVKNHWHCCDRIFSIYDENDNQCMTIRGSCCQPGNFCFAPCEPCNEIVFDVTNERTGAVGHIKRRWDTWLRQLFTNADTFTIDFPPNSTLHERILLLAATFLLNMMFFEQKKDNNSSSGSSFGGDGGDFGGGGFDFDGFDDSHVCNKN